MLCVQINSLTHTNSILNVSIKTKTHTDIHSILSLYFKSYSTQLECCNGAYANQGSSYCLLQIENYFDDEDYEEVYYPNYNESWDK